jgi:hypothetical protein
MGSVGKFKGTKTIYIKQDEEWGKIEITYIDLKCINEDKSIDWYFEGEFIKNEYGAFEKTYCIPSMHVFEETIVFQNKWWECRKCGLNLYYDKNTEAYRKWEKYYEENKLSKWPWDKKEEDK